MKNVIQPKDSLNDFYTKENSFNKQNKIPKIPQKSQNALSNTSTAQINDKILSPKLKVKFEETEKENVVNKNLMNEFEEVASETKKNTFNSESKISPEQASIENKNITINSVNLTKEKQLITTPSHKVEDKILSVSKTSLNQGCDFTFKKFNVDAKSDLPASKTPSSSNLEIIDYINNGESFKLSIATVSPPVEKEELKKHEKKPSRETNEIKKSKNLEISSSSQFTPNSQIINPEQDHFNTTEENVIEDEFEVNEHGNIPDNHSVISSKILSHVNNPKMFGGIRSELDQSVNFSMSRLETHNNLLITESITQLPHIGQEDTEFEITNEYSDRFEKFIETPKSSNIYFSGMQKNHSMPYLNPQLRDLNERLSRREKDTKRVNEKIQKIVNDLHQLEEENKRFERRIEKEEAEGEMLRHMLNFLMTNA